MSDDLGPPDDEADDSDVWLCSCGHIEDSIYCCSVCRAEPPWGCDCDAHDADFDDDLEPDLSNADYDDEPPEYPHAYEPEDVEE